MWLKQAISQYSRTLSMGVQQKPWDPLWMAKKRTSTAEVSSRFLQGVAQPLVAHLNQDLGLRLHIAPGGSCAPSFRLLDSTGQYVGLLYMANPMNGRGFFRFPNGRSVELHTYRNFKEELKVSLSQDIDKKVAPSEGVDQRRPRGRGR